MELGFKTDELDALELEPGHHGDEDFYAGMLRRWLDWGPHRHPTLSSLAAALHAVGKESLANDLERQGENLFGMCHILWHDRNHYIA